MKKYQKLRLVLKRVQIADAFVRLAVKLYELWNMTNNYNYFNEPKMVFKI
jgi:hypothetical protein